MSVKSFIALAPGRMDKNFFDVLVDPADGAALAVAQAVAGMVVAERNLEMAEDVTNFWIHKSS
jgi:hypothetical protein